MDRYATFHDLEGQSVFITGGGSGIGAALTEGFVAQGAQGRLRAALRRRRLRRRDGGASTARAPLFMPCDITDIAALQAAMAQAAAAHGPITVLVNNAANDPRHPIEGYTRRGVGPRRRRSTCARISSPPRRRCPGMKAAGGGVDRQLLLDLLHDGQRRLSRLHRRQGRHHRPDPRPRPRPRPRQHPRQRADARLGADPAAARPLGDARGASPPISSASA